MDHRGTHGQEDQGCSWDSTPAEPEGPAWKDRDLLVEPCGSTQDTVVLWEPTEEDPVGAALLFSQRGCGLSWWVHACIRRRVAHLSCCSPAHPAHQLLLRVPEAGGLARLWESPIKASTVGQSQSFSSPFMFYTNVPCCSTF